MQDLYHQQYEVQQKFHNVLLQQLRRQADEREEGRQASTAQFLVLQYVLEELAAQGWGRAPRTPGGRAPSTPAPSTPNFAPRTVARTKTTTLMRCGQGRLSRVPVLASACTTHDSTPGGIVFGWTSQAIL